MINNENFVDNFMSTIFDIKIYLHNYLCNKVQDNILLTTKKR